MTVRAAFLRWDPPLRPEGLEEGEEAEADGGVIPAGRLVCRDRAQHAEVSGVQSGAQQEGRGAHAFPRLLSLLLLQTVTCFLQAFPLLPAPDHTTKYTTQPCMHYSPLLSCGIVSPQTLPPCAHTTNNCSMMHSVTIFFSEGLTHGELGGGGGKEKRRPVFSKTLPPLQRKDHSSHALCSVYCFCLCSSLSLKHAH